MTEPDPLEPYSPRALYLAAHQTQWVGAWFQRVLMGAQLAVHPDPQIQTYKERLMGALKEERTYIGPVVHGVNELVRAHGLDAPDAPSVPDDWEPWSLQVFRVFASRMDPKDPANAPFAFGWEHGRVRATLAVLVTGIEIHRQGADRRATIVAGMRDLIELVQRWPMSADVMAQLEGSEPTLDVWRQAKPHLDGLSRADAGREDVDTLVSISSAARTLLEAYAHLEHIALTTLPTQAPSA